jgi:hypothetical protein
MIYPLYDYIVGRIARGKSITTTGEITTYIRKKLGNLYYLTLMRIQYELPPRIGVPAKYQKTFVFNALLQLLILNAYKFIKLGKVIPDGLYNWRGESINAILDPDQSTERERLT